jgi:hypothetical protein
MAKSKTKEASTPLIFSLVFFILTTVAFGVMWYLAYSDVEQARGNEAKAKSDLTKPRSDAREAELKARVYRTYMGIEIDGVTDDKTVLAAESKPGDVIAAELNKINAAMAKKLGVPDAAGLPDDFKFWTTDEKNKAKDSPAEGLTDLIAKLKNKDVAYTAADKERESYKSQVEAMKTAAKGLKDVQDKFQKEIERLPAEFKQDLKKVTDAFDTRTKAYQASEAASGKKITDVTEERDRLEGQVRKLKDQVASLQSDNQALQLRVTKSEGGRDAFVFDEPQGKILRKLPEGVVELNIGSAAGVRPGLTFTVLPSDFPEKGRQSRMRMLRAPDGKGGFKSVETFVPRGAVEVYEVVGPTLSLARIQPGSELDPIRDSVGVGDLIYNSVWRKGVADHIALVGIFDINGDGTDDIESVVRDLTKMGIPVDAYYDMKKRAWVGQVTERTRYIIEGYMPINSALDPNREEKTKLLGAIGAAISEGKQKGVETVNFRDFFSRMGYKFRLDVNDDVINKATAPYLSNVGLGGPVPMPPSP